MNYKVFKRFIDFSCAFIGLIILSPVFLGITILLVFVNQGTPFFVQARPGRNGKVFHLLKFKTMNDKRDSAGFLLPDDMRMTSIGNVIRKTSLDEIPQLVNVLTGDMSLIGPRPLLVEYLPLYSTEQAKRHQVRPGITGWAQVNGRNQVSWGEKFEMDLWYIKNMSFAVDLKILFLTIKKVLLKEGISSQTSVTMEKFTGN